MSKRLKSVDWSSKDGASPKPKRLHLEEDENDKLYHCPMANCAHDGFSTQRGFRKHVKNTVGFTTLMKSLRIQQVKLLKRKMILKRHQVQIRNVA